MLLTYFELNYKDLINNKNYMENYKVISVIETCDFNDRNIYEHDISRISIFLDNGFSIVNVTNAIDIKTSTSGNIGSKMSCVITYTLRKD